MTPNGQPRNARQSDAIRYSTCRDSLLSALEMAHETFYAAGVFAGPSLHFHYRALEEADKGLSGFAESSYSMLAAWGMHRMGRGGAKMCDFAQYKESVRKAWPRIELLRMTEPSTLTDAGWDDLRIAFHGIKAMQSAFSLVATSKVLAHALPALVPPVDRQYTIRFLYGSKTLPKSIEGEWNLLRAFLEGFFYPVLQDQRFLRAFARWQLRRDDYVWDTSRLKTIDNLVVGYLRNSTSQIE